MGRYQRNNLRLYNIRMKKPTFKKTYIKEWRLHRGLSLRQLAARIEKEPGEELISFASLGRIEKGQQPYSQPILEGLSRALDVSPSMLLEMNPERDGQVIDLVRHLNEEKREQAIKILKALAG